MAKGGGAAQAIADGINGYIRGTQIKRGMDNEEEERAWRNEQRETARSDRARVEDERRQLTQAAAPVVVEQGAGGMTKPETADNRDVGQPGDVGMAQGGLTAGVRVGGQAYADLTAGNEAAAKANAPEAIQQRQADAYRRIGKPMEAAQLEAAGTQGKLAKLQLADHEVDFINKKFDAKLAGVQTPQQLAEVLSGSPQVEGKQVSVTMNGNKAQLVALQDDGTFKPIGKEFDPTAKGAVAKMVTTYAQGMKPHEKIAALQHFDDKEEQARQFEETKRIQQEQFGKTYGLHERQLAQQASQHAASMGLQREHLNDARQARQDSLKNDPFHNLPGGVKLRVQGMQKGIDTIDTALAKAMAEPGFDPSSPGVKDLQTRRAVYLSTINDTLKPYVPEYASDGGYDKLKGTGAPSAAPGGKPDLSKAPMPATMIGGGTRDPSSPTGWTAQKPAATGTAAPVIPPGAPPAGAAGMAARGVQSAQTPVSSAVPAPTPGAAAAAGTGDPLAKALGADSPSMAAIMAPRVAQIRQAGEVLRAAQAQVVKAAQTRGDVASATQAAAAAGAAIEAALQDLNPAQAVKVRQALGI